MSYKSNEKEVFDRVKKIFTNIGGEAGIKKVGQIASTIASNNVRRIHNEGKAVDESLIDSKARFKGKRKGAYSKSYATKRQKKGRQINKVDLSFSGGLSKSFQVARNGNKWNIGFIRDSKLSVDLEDLYKQNIWGVTSEDRKVITIEFNKFIRERVKGR